MAFGKFGKYHPNGANYRPEIVDLVEELATTIDQFKDNEGQKHQINFTTDTDSCELYTDPLHLKYIIVNLLQNAAKYSHEASEIDVTLATRDAQPWFVVCDQGIGVPQDELDELFSPFYRASNVADRSGTGMGLPIVKQSARLIGATVSASSEEGQGSVFTVKLPGRKGRPPA